MDGAHTVHEGDSTPCKVVDRKPGKTDCLKLTGLKKKHDGNVD